MKRFLLSIIACFFVYGFQAQIYTDDGRYELIGKDNKEIFKATGSPYLKDEFSPGKIYFEGKPALSVFLRYNIHNETIEIKPQLDSEEIFKVNEVEKATYEMDGLKVIPEDFFYKERKVWGFFIVHYEGRQYKLLEKPEIKVTPSVKRESGYSEDKPAKMTKASTFYVLDSQGEIKQLNLRHKEVKKLFVSAKAEEFLDRNKIKTKEDLIALLEFLDNNS